ncbi:auxin-responsive protein SAUR78-like [Syzygium oleosum]|uniref:auxin-responsive protein SAUR78-like n=1 Tax=Syzygium oleosum TaxID=219896 RepID=UPI0024BBE51D|nr:auxin-responsive protein SAUR78-like [Syzygium oleosum]
MTKMGKLTKLKSAIRRFPSFSKLSRNNSAAAAVAAAEDDPRSAAAGAGRGNNVRAVYVGKSRRRYDVSARVFEHPLFRELVDKSSSSSPSSPPPPPTSAAVVSCEVVLFEHLLWMLENSGDGDAQLGSMDELVEFYTTG